MQRLYSLDLNRIHDTVAASITKILIVHLTVLLLNMLITKLLQKI